MKRFTSSRHSRFTPSTRPRVHDCVWTTAVGPYDAFACSQKSQSTVGFGRHSSDTCINFDWVSLGAVPPGYSPARHPERFVRRFHCPVAHFLGSSRRFLRLPGNCIAPLSHSTFMICNCRDTTLRQTLDFSVAKNLLAGHFTFPRNFTMKQAFRISAGSDPTPLN